MSTNDTSRFSLFAFAVALLAVGTGASLGLRFVPVYGTYVGILAGGLLAGLVVEHRPTVESGVAAVLASLGVLVAGALPGNGVVDAVLTVAAVDPVTAFVSAALSFAVGAFGGHFGDDLRDGLTEPLPEPAPASTSSRTVPRASATDRAAETDEEAREPADADDAVAAQDEGGETSTADDVEYELE